jgi:hypothetical protein
MDELVNVSLTVARVAAFNKVLYFAFMESTVGAVQLKGPQKVVDSLEVWTNCKDFMDNIFNANNTKMTESSFNNFVVGKRDTLFVNLAITALVDKFTDRLQVRITIGYEGLNKAEHLRGRVRQTDKDTVVDLYKTQKLQNLAGLRAQLVNTTKII